MAEIVSPGWEMPKIIYALGMHYVENDKKSVILIIGYDIILTYVIRNIRDHPSISQIKLDKMCSIKLEEEITNIVMSPSLTFALTVEGDIYYFETYKRLTKIHSIQNIVTAIPYKDGIAAISVNSKEVLLKIYSHDCLTDEYCSPLILDLSVESLGCRSNEEIFIKSLVIDDQNKTYFQNLLQCEQLNTKTDFFLIGIDNQLLKIGFDEDAIFPIKYFPCKISKFWYSKKLNVLIVLLKSGVIEIIYSSDSPPYISTQDLYLGTRNKLICDYLENEDIMIYSDWHRFNQARLTYSTEEKRCKLHNQSFDIKGTIQYVFVQSINKLLIISENNKFYFVGLINPNFNSIDEKKLISVDTQNLDNIDKIETLLKTKYSLYTKLQTKINSEVNDFKYRAMIFGDKSELGIIVTTCKVIHDSLNYENVNYFDNNFILTVQLHLNTRQLELIKNYENPCWWMILIQEQSKTTTKIIEIKDRIHEVNFSFRILENFKVPLIRSSIFATVKFSDDYSIYTKEIQLQQLSAADLLKKFGVPIFQRSVSSIEERISRIFGKPINPLYQEILYDLITELNEKECKVSKIEVHTLSCAWSLLDEAFKMYSSMNKSEFSIILKKKPFRICNDVKFDKHTLAEYIAQLKVCIV